MLARTLAFFDAYELNPRGKVFLPNLVPFIVERFKFAKYPASVADYDTGKGISFEAGFFDGEVVDNFTLYSDGVKLDLRSTTENGVRIIGDTLAWLRDFGIAYDESTVTRWAFVSNIVFNSQLQLTSLSPALTRMCEKANTLLKADPRNVKRYEVDTIKIDLDRTLGDIKISPIIIQKRANVPFSEGRFFSAAPLRTEPHIALLEEFEKNAVGAT